MAEKEKKEKVQSVVVKESVAVDGFISEAIQKNLPVETMERLFALREKVNAEAAKAAFVTALANFQSVCPVIEKKKKVMNKDGSSVRYQYAPLDVITQQIKKPLSENGLSYTWKVENEMGGVDEKTKKNLVGYITAKAIITHVMGHSEVSEFKVPTDPDAYMTAPQIYASALTFAKRYSLCNALGISTSEEDTDAVDVNKEKDAKSPKAKIIILLRKLGVGNTTKEEIERNVSQLAQLSLEPQNYDEIVGRLEILVKEKQEHDASKKV